MHPLAIIGGTLVENPFFTPPDALLAEMRSRTAATHPSDDIRLLRSSLREIISLSALTVIWRDRGVARIAEDLVESMLVTVRPDLMYVRLEGVTGEAPVEATHVRDQAGVLRPRPEIAPAVAPLLTSPDADVREVPDPIGAGSMRLAAVPIGAAGNYGVLAAGFRRPDLPTETDRLLLRVAANQAAATFEALANDRLRLEVATRRQAEQHEAQLASELRALAAHITAAREEERRRIALELHDELGQALTALKFDLGRLVRGLPRDTGTQRHLQEMLERVAATIRSVRRMGTQLHPPVLDTLGLSDAIDWQVKEFQARTGIRCTVSLRARALELPADRATPIFRILQEALTNVAKHARATRVTVSLRRHGGNLQLRIRDNGKGFRSPDRANVQAVGIVGMRERAIILGGEATITSVRGRGTTVTVRVPYRRPDASERRQC
jgi:signal transduction histidine kinase